MQVYSNRGENSSSNATTPPAPSFLPSNNPSDSSEGSDKDDDASGANSDSEEDSSPGTRDGKTLEGKGEELEKDEEEKEDGGKSEEDEQSDLKSLHSDSSALIEKMIKLQRQVDQEKSDGRKEGEVEEEKEEASSEETKSEERNESSERSLDGKGTKEIEFKTLNRIEEVASNSDQEQNSGTDNLSSSTQLLEELGKTADIIGSEKDGESETRSISKDGLTEEKILQRIAAIEKYRKDAESNNNEKDHLAVQVLERYKVCFACLPMSTSQIPQPLLLGNPNFNSVHRPEL